MYIKYNDNLKPKTCFNGKNCGGHIFDNLVREEILAEFNFVILAVIREIQLIT